MIQKISTTRTLIMYYYDRVIVLAITALLSVYARLLWAYSALRASTRAWPVRIVPSPIARMSDSIVSSFK